MSFVNLKTLHLGESDYLFATCYFNFDNIIIGNKDAIVVAWALKLSLDTLLSKANNTNIISCDESEVVSRFYLLAEENLIYNVLPTCIESFDSDMGLFFI